MPQVIGMFQQFASRGVAVRLLKYIYLLSDETVQQLRRQAGGYLQHCKYSCHTYEMQSSRVLLAVGITGLVLT